MKATDLLQLRPEGLFCPPGGFFIDPSKPVGKAVVTHGHADHCTPGSRALLATAETVAIARARYGGKAFGAVQPLHYGETIRIKDVDLRLVPAGHVLGSAQVVIEAGGKRAVVSGDYKRSADPTCAAFEPVNCDLFVTEATFGLPVFRHPPIETQIARLIAAVTPDRPVAVGAYSLGKAQRLMAEVRRGGYGGRILVHGALVGLCNLYQRLGVDIGPWAEVKGEKASLNGAIILAPPGALNGPWARRIAGALSVGASGWMQVRQRAKQRGVELPLVISDHADWDGLTATITETGAETVWVTHGAEEALCHWCATQGIDARPLALAGRDAEAE